eukprot:TRINITY_DN5102_c0_g1_i3.p1 TRINITY_DN5102_c0_g1~~TRINITY_DN5102_c0_g1_i3.p1  ORF type:complete len:338 (-),score=60.52 TRINITY_DN5102_c0_g1_i3:108-1070(-)
MSELSREELLELLNQTKSKLAKKEGECDALKAEIKDNQRSQSLFADKMESRFKEFATTVKKGMFVEFQRMEKHLAEHAKDHANDQMEEVWTKYVEPKLEEINDGLINREDTKEQNYQDQIKELNDKISTDLIDIKSVCTGLQKDMETNITILDEKVTSLVDNVNGRIDKIEKVGISSVVPIQTKLHDHALMHYKYHIPASFMCDGCKKTFEKGYNSRYRCTCNCDYDLCGDCIEESVDTVHFPVSPMDPQFLPTTSFYGKCGAGFGNQILLFDIFYGHDKKCSQCLKKCDNWCGLARGQHSHIALCQRCIPKALVRNLPL